MKKKPAERYEVGVVNKFISKTLGISNWKINFLVTYYLEMTNGNNACYLTKKDEIVTIEELKNRVMKFFLKQE